MATACCPYDLIASPTDGIFVSPTTTLLTLLVISPLYSSLEYSTFSFSSIQIILISEGQLQSHLF